jgi:hypothetical protein
MTVTNKMWDALVKQVVALEAKVKALEDRRTRARRKSAKGEKALTTQTTLPLEPAKKKLKDGKDYPDFEDVWKLRDDPELISNMGADKLPSAFWKVSGCGNEALDKFAKLPVYAQRDALEQMVKERLPHIPNSFKEKEELLREMLEHPDGTPKYTRKLLEALKRLPTYDNVPRVLAKEMGKGTKTGKPIAVSRVRPAAEALEEKGLVTCFYHKGKLTRVRLKLPYKDDPRPRQGKHSTKSNNSGARPQL